MTVPQHGVVRAAPPALQALRQGRGRHALEAAALLHPDGRWQVASSAKGRERRPKRLHSKLSPSFEKSKRSQREPPAWLLSSMTTPQCFRRDCRNSGLEISNAANIFGTFLADHSHHSNATTHGLMAPRDATGSRSSGSEEQESVSRSISLEILQICSHQKPSAASSRSSSSRSPRKALDLTSQGYEARARAQGDQVPAEEQGASEGGHAREWAKGQPRRHGGQPCERGRPSVELLPHG